MARNELIGLWSDLNFEQQIEFSLKKNRVGKRRAGSDTRQELFQAFHQTAK
jgi:hypothetical protein